MKNLKISFILLETFSMLVLVLFIYYISFHINNIEKSPFGLEKSYIKISTRYMHDPEEKIMDKLGLKLKNILSSHKSTVILDNFNSQGLGVYDTGYFYSNFIVEGKYFDENEFLKNTSNILVTKDSFVYNYSTKNNNTYYSNNNYFNVKGILSPSSGLLNENHSFVYSLLNTRNFSGDYYINYKDKSLANDIYNFFQNNGFQTEIKYFNKENTSFHDIFLSVSKEKFISLMEIGVVIIYFNMFLYFIYFLFKERKNIYIRKLVGGSNNKIYMFFSKKVILNSIIGTLLAIFIYNLIFKLLNYSNTVFTSALSILMASFAHILLTYLIFTITFYLSKYSNYGGYSKV